MKGLALIDIVLSRHNNKNIHNMLGGNIMQAIDNDTIRLNTISWIKMLDNVAQYKQQGHITHQVLLNTEREAI